MKRLILLLFLILPFLFSFDEIRDPDRIDVNDVGYYSSVITVGTSQVEVKTDTTKRRYRQRILIYNDSGSTVYVGPTGVTTTGSTKGVPLYKKQTMVIPLGNVGIFLIAGSASNDVIVQVLE